MAIAKAAGDGARRSSAAKAAPRKRVATKGVPVGGTSLSGDLTVASVISGGGGARLPEMQVYWMVATTHPYVNSCITLVADAIAGDGYAVMPKNGDIARPLDSKSDPRVGDINDFFDVAFPGSTFRSWRYGVAVDMEAFGLAYLQKKRAGGLLVGLERLDPRTVTATLSSDQTKIVSYQVRQRNSNGVVDLQHITNVDAKDVVLFTRGGGDPITGSPSPLEALDLTCAIDEAARRFRMAFFNSGGKIGTILSNETASKDQMQAAERKMKQKHTGPDNAFGTLLLTGAWKLVGQLESGSDDASFVKLSGLNREDVASVYHVPVGMITFAGSALGSAGKGDDRDFFEEFAVLPLEELIYERLTLSILGDEFGIDDLELAPKRRNRVRTSRFDAAVNLVKFGGTGNEARDLVGLAKIIDPKFEMDTPLFIGSPTTGLAEAEPLETPPAPVTPSSEQGNGDPATSAASAAGANADHDKREVTKKGKGGFRWTSEGGR
jgi:HK97 family phage portal protein